MNERIFEIVQGLNGRVGLTWAEEDKAEFAELIVRECADTVLGFRNQFGDSAHAEIKQHFGVK